MNPEKAEKLKELTKLIQQLKLENKGTNFEATISKHVGIVAEYNDPYNEKGRDAFPDRETYQMFGYAKLFVDRMRYIVFQKQNESSQTENILKDNDMPPLEAFHGSEVAAKKQDFKNIVQGDILHLQVVEDSPEYKLMIINKYGDKERLIDSSLFAVLFKTNTLVQEISPPLQVSDLVRAVVFGNAIEDQDGTKKLRMSLNPRYINDMTLKNLVLGRVTERDIPFYPKEVRSFKNLSQYIQAQRDSSPQEIFQQISAGGCDPSKTCPLFESCYAFRDKQLSADPIGLSDDWSACLPDQAELDKKIDYCNQKSEIAQKALDRGDLQAALFEIQEAISSFPRCDTALTIRGKIYLAMAGHTSSSKVKAAFLDFEEAMKINCHNKEAAALRDVIIMQSVMRYEKGLMLTKADELRACLECTDNTPVEAFIQSIRPLKKTKPTPSIASESDVKEEKMDF